MSMSPRLLRPRQNIHPEAADWASRVRANGGTAGVSLPAVNSFCKAIDAAGIRSKILRANLFCGGGGNTNAFLVPLYLGSSISNRIGGTLDTNVGGLFVSGDYNETGASGGLTGGTTRYLTTGLLTSALPAIDTGHLAAYVMTGIGGAAISGILTSWASGFGNPIYLLETNRDANGGLIMSWGNNFSGVGISAASGAGNGFLGCSRTLSTDLRFYKNGSQIGSTSAASISPVANNGGGFGVFANVGQSGLAGNYFSGRMGGYSIGTGLTAAEMAAYNTAMQAFQTALSRNV